jgi:hypothetical protein
MIVFDRGFLSVGEVWFNREREAAAPPGVDAIDFMQSLQPVAGALVEEFHTLVVDLAEPADALFGKISESGRRKIRRAEKEQLEYRAFDDCPERVLNDLRKFYDRFAAQKKLPGLDIGLLKGYAARSNLAISQVVAPDGSTLTFHSFIRADGRVRLLHSPSLFRESVDSAYRSFVGRANRYHHWQDMLHWKSEGDSIYDLGGWYHGKDDQEKLAINRFKEEFGGRPDRNFNCQYGVSLKGKAYVRLRAPARRLIDRLRRVAG